MIDITTKRRVDISGYGEGWDGCYLTMKTMSPKDFAKWFEVKGTDEGAETATLNDLYSDLMKELLIGGVIINSASGEAEKYTLADKDLPDLIEQLDVTHKQDALRVAAGTYGLKGL
ncbi:hypothetical protein [Rhodococcus sp. NPDC004095]